MGVIVGQRVLWDLLFGGKNNVLCSVVNILLIMCDDERLWSTLREIRLYFLINRFFPDALARSYTRCKR